MGNMIFNQRLQENVSEKEEKGEMRIFPKHMYTGPKGLGDPHYRGLSKMEEDPLIPQRMRDTIRTTYCKDIAEKFRLCGVQHGMKLAFNCKDERDDLVACVEQYFYNEDFKAQIVEEYLNERSHYRETGIKTNRYKRGAFVPRDETDPPFDTEGNYRPRKPKGWDEAYKDREQPSWNNFKYN